jgi:NitT/TauT family transport system ATP-binding protein
VDDAFRGADGFVREALAELLRGLRRRAGVSILFATTSIHEAVHAGDRVAAMASHPGRILEIVEVPLPDARPPECREDPAFVEAARRVRAALRAGRVYDA